MTTNIVSSELPLDNWYGSAMGIIQQDASHHFGVKSASPRDHWMTPEAWNVIVTRQAQVSKVVVYRRALFTLGCFFFFDDGSMKGSVSAKHQSNGLELCNKIFTLG